MNVISLFDGMSCGRIALDKVGIKVDKYMACEIDPYDIAPVEKRFRIEEIGSTSSIEIGVRSLKANKPRRVISSLL